MKLCDITGQDLVIEDLKAGLRTDALREILELVGRKRGLRLLEVETYLAEVLRRHDRIPSGLGRGLAFPNARLSDLKRPILAVGLSRRGLDFQARDGRPAHVVLLYLGRVNPPEDEGRMLGRLSRALSDPGVVELLMGSSSAEEILKALVSIDTQDSVPAR